ncbi:hypothetical protein [Burkholderia sp. Bp8986]|uniref:hypothetical protein n=1 Tax=Burkholderia sp. Bp8986 TaxID=2184550 RepID=UPI000F5A0476|nr:hypothetical protein [Burkholderia sp. Bp8986]
MEIGSRRIDNDEKFALYLCVTGGWLKYGVSCILILASTILPVQPTLAKTFIINRDIYLAAAQRSIDDACASIDFARGGDSRSRERHVKRAKSLLRQAEDEIKADALTANVEGWH